MSIIEKGWPGWGGEKRLLLGKEQIRKILSKGFIPSIGNVLELGFGEGNLCRILNKNNYEVTGIDISRCCNKMGK